MTSGRHGGGVVATSTRTAPPAEDTDEEFAYLLRAARALLKKGASDEEEVFPTLQLAGRARYKPPPLLHENVSMVDVVDGVPILKQDKIRVDRHRGPLAGDTLTAFHVTIFPHEKAMSAGEIARIYEEALEAEGVTWGTLAGRVQYAFCSNKIVIKVERLHPLSAGVPNYVVAISGDEGEWAPPQVVGSTARVVLEQFAPRLVLRRSGPRMAPYNLILATTAYLLGDEFVTDDWDWKRKEVHRCLNEYVLCERPQELLLGDVNSSEVVRLWRNVRKVVLMDDVYGPGPIEVDGPFSP